jgi:hypothetical protein
MPTWRFTVGEASQHREELQEFLSPQEIEIVLAVDSAAVHAEAVRLKNNENIRTLTVITALNELGQKLGYEPRNGWLFDSVWFTKRQVSWLPVESFIPDTKWGDLEGLKLACESECNGAPNKVLEDFAKLTVVMADFKVFIHSNQYHNGSSLTTTVDLCKSILRYSTGHRYLFIGFDKGKPEFRVDLVLA